MFLFYRQSIHALSSFFFFFFIPSFLFVPLWWSWLIFFFERLGTQRILQWKKRCPQQLQHRTDDKTHDGRRGGGYRDLVGAVSFHMQKGVRNEGLGGFVKPLRKGMFAKQRCVWTWFRRRYVSFVPLRLCLSQGFFSFLLFSVICAGIPPSRRDH